MRTLLVDNSNTRTKFALADNEALLDWRAVVTTAEISAETLREALQGETWDNSIISSVVPKKAAVLADFLAAKPCHQLSYRSQLPIGIQYPKPEQIGADRLANAAGAHILFGSPSIVLDFGTAVTFDVIGHPNKPSTSKSADDCKGVQACSTDDGKGEQACSIDNGKEAQAFSYLGGVIAPGLASMTEGLARRTALLPHIQLEEPSHAIGTSTEEAMLAGAVYGYRGLVKEIIQELKKEITGDPVIIATGGDAPLITQGLPEIQHLSPQLTMEGLRIIAQLNF